MAISPFLGALDVDADLGVDNFLGRRRRRGAAYHRTTYHPGVRQAAAMSRANRVAELVNPDVPGAPARDAALLPAGFPLFSFTNATGLNPITQQMNVQTPFRGQRLVAQVLRSGASAALTAPLIHTLQVGMKPVITTANPVGMEIFGQNAFDVNLILPPTTPGTIYQLTLALPIALGAGDTITVIVGLLGSAVL